MVLCSQRIAGIRIFHAFYCFMERSDKELFGILIVMVCFCCLVIGIQKNEQSMILLR